MTDTFKLGIIAFLFSSLMAEWPRSVNSCNSAVAGPKYNFTHFSNDLNWGFISRSSGVDSNKTISVESSRNC